ncbi:Hypothetical predicted protein [Podarcis lilfordi]|uniref:Uncharacterized protein n=1 Tax=Podarcis lilfordi TaxID=74358 RepID=A0AA35JP65_9SAUR|nr:Hypothetical predicted protein [Podarcis lilfordi]
MNAFQSDVSWLLRRRAGGSARRGGRNRLHLNLIQPANLLILSHKEYIFFFFLKFSVNRRGRGKEGCF